MEKLISFIRINKNNEEYTQNQAIGIAQYLHKNNLQLHNNVEIEINIFYFFNHYRTRKLDNNKKHFIEKAPLNGRHR